MRVYQCTYSAADNSTTNGRLYTTKEAAEIEGEDRLLKENFMSFSISSFEIFDKYEK